MRPSTYLDSLCLRGFKEVSFAVMVKPNRSGVVWSAVLALVAVLAAGTLALAQTDPASLDALMRAAQLGPYQPQEEDWEAIEAAAKQEGEVVIYSLSSRHPTVAAIFEERYGIKVHYAGLGTEEQLARLNAQQRAGRPEADVLFLAEHPQVNQWIEEGRLVGYVPRYLEPVIPVSMRTPALKHATEVLTVFYNNDTYSESPVSSWWDLTKPEWHGKIFSGDYTTSAPYQQLFAAWIQEADELEAEYERVFGEPIQYTQPYQNAGWELLKRLLDQKPRRLSSPAELMTTLATPGFDGLVLLGTGQIRRAPELLRTNPDGSLDLPLSTAITPKWGLLFSHNYVIPTTAPHPNAAKLLVRFLAEREGYEPWHTPGSFPVRTDFDPPEYTPALDPDTVWVPDLLFLDEIQAELLDFMRLYE